MIFMGRWTTESRKVRMPIMESSSCYGMTCHSTNLFKPSITVTIITKPLSLMFSGSCYSACSSFLIFRCANTIERLDISVCCNFSECNFLEFSISLHKCSGTQPSDVEYFSRFDMNEVAQVFSILEAVLYSMCSMHWCE